MKRIEIDDTIWEGVKNNLIRMKSENIEAADTLRYHIARMEKKLLKGQEFMRYLETIKQLEILASNNIVLLRIVFHALLKEEKELEGTLEDNKKKIK